MNDRDLVSFGGVEKWLASLTTAQKIAATLIFSSSVIAAVVCILGFFAFLGARAR